MRSSWLAGLLVAAFVSVAHAAAVQPQSQEQSPPTNDDFANAQALPDSTGVTMGNLYYATRERGEAELSTFSYGATVWYKFTAARTGRAVVELAPLSDFRAPLQMQAFSGPAVTSLKRLAKTQVTGNKPFTPSAGSVAFDTLAGSTYYLQIDIASGGVDDSSKVDFMIAMQQFGAAGGLGMLTLQPAIIRDETYDQYFMLIANGFKTAAKLKVNLLRGGRQMEVWAPKANVAAGQVEWLSVLDNNDQPVNEAVPGRLQVVATDASTSASMGTRTIDLVLVPNGGGSQANLTTRFAMPSQGVTRSSRFSSSVAIKNNSNISVRFCQFSEASGLMIPRWKEIFPDGTLGKMNAPFSIEAGQIKKFIVSATSFDDDFFTSTAIKPRCPNYTSPSDPLMKYMDGMRGVSQFGNYAAVKIAFPAANDLRQISMGGRKIKPVVAAITNTGKYAGSFFVGAYRRNDDFFVKSMCIADRSGRCKTAPKTSQMYISLANGETGYVTLAVASRSDAARTDEIYVWLGHASWSLFPDAGASGFEVTE